MAEEKDNNKKGAVGVVVMVVDLENAQGIGEMRMKINGDDYHNVSSSSSAAFLQSHHTIPHNTME